MASDQDGFRSTVSGDGKAVTLTVTSDGKPTTFDLPSEQLTPFMLFISQTATKAKRKQTGQPTAFHMIPIERWRAIPSPKPETVLLQFQVTGGIETTFQIPRSRIPDMIQALQRLLSEPPSSSTKQ